MVSKDFDGRSNRMPKYLIIVQRDDEVKSYSFEDASGIAEFTEMLRDFNHPYEIYRRDDTDEFGYIRTCRWPAKI